MMVGGVKMTGMGGGYSHLDIRFTYVADKYT